MTAPPDARDDRRVGGVIVYVVRDSLPEPTVLFMQRAGPHAGSWWPVAGTPKPDEAPGETALRELQEETGIQGEPLIDFGLEIPHMDPAKRLCTYVVRVPNDIEVVLNHEHTAYRWLSGNEAVASVPEHSRGYLQHLVDHFIKPGQAGTLGGF